MLIKFTGGSLNGESKELECYGNSIVCPILEKHHRTYIMPDYSTGMELANEHYDLKLVHGKPNVAHAIFREKIEHLKPKNAVYFDGFV